MLVAFALLGAGALLTMAVAILTGRERAERTSGMAMAAGFVFILGTLTWRARTTSDLAENPLDVGSAVRIAADIGAVGLAFLSFWAHQEGDPERGGRLPWLYAGYITAAAFGVFFAVAPLDVLFRVCDLAACLIVAVALARAVTLQQVVDFWRWALLGMAAAIVGSALLVPSVGLVSARGGLVPIRLEGVFPEFSANSVGFVGTLLVVVAMGSGRVRRWTLLLGLALVLLSQYRTGYIAVAAVLAVWLAVRGDALRRVGLLLAVPLGYLLVQTAAFEEAWVRGEAASNSTGTLSGRTIWWDVAFDVAERSPIIGTGLTSGTRYEVLTGRLGLEGASTIHGTWIEVYVGTGIIGLLILVWFVLAAARWSWRARAVSLAPLLAVAAIGVRSLTGTSVELASVAALAFLTFALSAEVTLRRQRPDRERQAGYSISV